MKKDKDLKNDQNLEFRIKGYIVFALIPIIESSVGIIWAEYFQEVGYSRHDADLYTLGIQMLTVAPLATLGTYYVGRAFK